MRRMWVPAVLAAALCWPPAARAQSSAPAAAAPGADRAALSAAVERWAQAVGGWENLQKVRGATLRGKQTESGIAGTFEQWVSRDGSKQVVMQGTDRSARVCDGRKAWVLDWNGKVQELEGRDAQDQRTVASIEGMLYAGFSPDAIQNAGAIAVHEDSTRAFRVIQFQPADGIPYSLYLDSKTFLPTKAVRKPFDEEIVLSFGDWRANGGVKVPFALHELGGEDSTGTVTSVDAIGLDQPIPATQFVRPEDGPKDYVFAAGNEALGIPFNFENDHIMIECSINGSKPIWFMLDTGAGATIINKNLGLAPFGAASVSGGGNSTDFAFTKIPSLTVGGVELRNQRDGVIDLHGLERIYGMPMGGILGYDFASRFLIKIHYETKTMDVFEPSTVADSSRGTRVPFILEKRHPHVQGTVTVPGADPIPADFVIDSGAAETANLTAPFVKAHRLTELARKTPAGKPNTIPGMESQFFAQTSVRGRLSTITLGSAQVTEIPVNLQMGTRGAYASASFSGTIGEGILHRFTSTYDYAHGVLILEPNAEFAKPFPPRKTFGASFLSDGPDYHAITVSGVRKGSPAEVAGFLKGDVIEALDGKPAADVRVADLRQALLDEGSQHVIEILRGTSEKLSLSLKVAVLSIEDN